MKDSFWNRLFIGVRRIHQRPDWDGFAGRDWADFIMATAVTDRFHAKQGRSTGRWIIQSQAGRLAVYLKRHYQLPWWRGMLAAVWPRGDWSPALQEWRHLQWARGQGLPVPAAVAAAEFIGPWGRLRSVLAVEELSGMVPLHEAVPAASCHLDPLRFAQWKRGLVSELARLVGDLHRRRWFHKDLYLCHFYVPEEDVSAVPHWPGRVHLIDLHRFNHHPVTFALRQVKDLAQFLYSSEIPGVTAWDRLRFWRSYLGPDQGGYCARLLRRLVVLKWRRYRRHNAKRSLP